MVRNRSGFPGDANLCHGMLRKHIGVVSPEHHGDAEVWSTQALEELQAERPYLDVASPPITCYQTFNQACSGLFSNNHDFTTRTKTVLVPESLIRRHKHHCFCTCAVGFQHDRTKAVSGQQQLFQSAPQQQLL